MTLRNAVIAFFVILAAIVVTKTKGGSQAADQLGQSAQDKLGVACAISPQPPATTGRTLLGAAQFRCDSPGPDQLTVTVHLQRKNGNAWTTLDGRSFTAAGAATTRSRSLAERTRQVSAGCTAGTFRTWAQATEVYHKQTRALSEYSTERRNPC